MNPKLTKWTRYEFWPFWLFYGPLTPWYIYKIFQAGAPAYFCSANPKMKWGGFIDYSKIDLLNQIDEKYKPKTVYFSEFTSQEIPFNFPFIAKPNIGERGIGVELIRNNEDWKNYLQLNNKDLILQEYYQSNVEFGVFYVRLPKEENGQIISITAKDFLTFKGDGKSTIQELIDQNIRAFYRKDYLLKRFKNQLHFVLKKEENLLIEPIGNHNRGTMFLDGSALKTSKLETTINQIAKNIDGFYYGRIDLKAKSVEDFHNGKFVILEINGANSEATHIYDPNYNLIKAYKEVIRHLNFQHKISVQNHQLGVKWTDWKLLAKALIHRKKT
jgi:hypothetical protein